MVAAAIAAALVARGERVAAVKPVITGLDEPPDPDWPHDHELLASLTAQTPDEVSPFRFGPPVSPHLAAELAGVHLDIDELIASVRDAAADADATIVEGVGGVLVPLAPGSSVGNLIGELRLPVVIAARPGLGTINHTMLTVAWLRSAGAAIAGVVVTPWPEDPGTVERSNRAAIEHFGGVRVSTLRRVPRAEAAGLAAAGASLPLDDWLG